MRDIEGFMEIIFQSWLEMINKGVELTFIEDSELSDGGFYNVIAKILGANFYRYGNQYNFARYIFTKPAIRGGFEILAMMKIEKSTICHDKNLQSEIGRFWGITNRFMDKKGLKHIYYIDNERAYFAIARGIAVDHN